MAISPKAMRDLRRLALTGYTGNYRRSSKHAAQPVAARRLGLSPRSISGLETEGARRPLEPLAYLGLAFLLGGEERARLCLEVLNQEEIEGAGVALRRELEE